MSEKCDECNGSGATESEIKLKRTCQVCGGKGKISWIQKAIGSLFNENHHAKENLSHLKDLIEIEARSVGYEVYIELTAVDRVRKGKFFRKKE